MHKDRGFTMVEIMITMGILAVLAATVFLVIKPFELIKEARYSRAKAELNQIAKAVQLYNVQNGDYPPDASRGELPSGLGKYLNQDGGWPNGPFPGSSYDYDNWTGQSCIDPDADDTIQISLRDVPGFNPDGSDVWTIYYVIYGNGTPHCTNADEEPYGECINCSSD